MTITYVEKHRKYDIYFDDRSEITGDTPRWLIDTGYSMISIDGSLTIEEVKNCLKSGFNA